MKKFNLDPSEGPHAASRLTDEELEVLQKIVAVEFAIRLDKADYRERFNSIAETRAEMDEIVFDLRNQRERMLFVASVEADLEQLPVTSAERT